MISSGFFDLDVRSLFTNMNIRLFVLKNPIFSIVIWKDARDTGKNIRRSYESYYLLLTLSCTCTTADLICEASKVWHNKEQRLILTWPSWDIRVPSSSIWYASKRSLPTGWRSIVQMSLDTPGVKEHWKLPSSFPKGRMIWSWKTRNRKFSSWAPSA